MADLQDSLMQAYREKLSKAIQDVNSESALNAIQKRDIIRLLPGMPRKEMFEFLNSNYRTGPDISVYVAQFVSPSRPRGGPGRRGTKPNTKKKA